jgi:peptidoglycan/LPS O-acetylase OafA/YrhL
VIGVSELWWASIIAVSNGSQKPRDVTPITQALAYAGYFVNPREIDRGCRRAMMRSPHDPSGVLQLASGSRPNNFGFLRLLFAVLVIVSHSPELIDGDRRREILTRMFGTLSFGELAVDGFFLISGFLITKSFIESPGLSSYLCKRAIRIVPAYVVSFWICVLFVAPFAGCEKDVFAAHVLWQQLAHNLLLLPPEITGCFHSLRHASLNGSMWTIAYEFSCYLLTALLGLAGLYHSRKLPILGALVVLFVLLHAFGYLDGFGVPGAAVFDSGKTNTRFISVYLVGALFYLFGGKIRLTGSGALISLGLLLPALFLTELAETAVIVFGAYIMFWFALKAPIVRMGRFTEVDISYGVYLYAWPIQSLLIRGHNEISPWMLCAVSTALAGCGGYWSWIVVEKPALDYLRRLRSGTYRIVGANA